MDFRKLEEYTLAMQERYAIPAYDLAVQMDGKEVYRKMDGYADSAKTRPVSEQDIYICFSASKVLTGAVLAKLLSEGRISLEDEASKYIPAFADVRVGVRNEQGEVIETHPAKNPILIRHLATMTAGMTYNFNTPDVQKAVAEGKKSAYELTPAMLAEPLLFEPGESYNYSLCLDALGGVIEAVTGMRLSEYVRENFTSPLGITDLTYHPTDEQRERITAQYTMQGKDADGRYLYKEIDRTLGFDFNGVFDSGGAGVYSTVNDYITFAYALANGGVGANGVRIMKPEAVELMRTPMLTSSQRKVFDRMGKYGCSYGLVVRTMVEPEKFGLCTPIGEFGWDGAASAYVTICPEAKLAMYFGIQVQNFGECFGVIHHKLRELVYEAVGFRQVHR